MSPQMLGQVITAHKLLGALRTLKPLLPRVRPSVPLQFVWPGESLAAVHPIAHKRTFAYLEIEKYTILSHLSTEFPSQNEPVCHLRCAFRWDVFPYTLLHPATWQMCCFFLSECRSPSAQLGHVQATRRTRGLMGSSVPTYLTLTLTPAWACVVGADDTSAGPFPGLIAADEIEVIGSCHLICGAATTFPLLLPPPPALPPPPPLSWCSCLICCKACVVRVIVWGGCCWIICATWMSELYD